MLSIVVLASGNGSNFQAIAEHAAQANFTVKALIANQDEAFALQRARKLGIPAHCVAHHAFTDRKHFEQAIDQVISQYTPVDYIILAGFMRVLTADFIKKYDGRIINLHPSLLPKYKGLQTHAKALAAGEKLHGMTIHFVNENLDEGPIILQVPVKITADDDVSSLMQKVQAKERQYYPQVISWLAQGRIRLEGTRVYFDDQLLTDRGIA